MRSRSATWDATIGWCPPSRRGDWAAIAAWGAAFERVVDANAKALDEMLAEWDTRLRELGGDPMRTEWSRFRPLRLSREEDWTDWLGHLLEHSVSGRFSARLFAGNPAEAERWKVTRAQREVVAGDYRADLVVHFEHGEWAHVEIKVGDLSLAKTSHTGEALQRAGHVRRRADFLIMPEEHVAVWTDQIPQLGAAAARIEVRTWHDVGRALRLSIAEEAEALGWRAWAFAFAGAVEQLLLGMPLVPLQVLADDGRAMRWSARAFALRRFLESIKEEP